MADESNVLVGRDHVQNFERGQQVRFDPRELGIQLPPLPPLRPSPYRLTVAEVNQETGTMTLVRRWSWWDALAFPARWLWWRMRRRRYRRRLRRQFAGTRIRIKG